MTSDIEAMKALEPCPFCGRQGRARVITDDQAFMPPNHHYIACSCGAGGPNERTDQDAITAWNRRAREAYTGGSGDRVREPSIERIVAAHSMVSKDAAEYGADHGDDLGWRHREYKQSPNEGCYFCALLNEIARLRSPALPAMEPSPYQRDWREAVEIVKAYAVQNPRWTANNGEPQDPMGAHDWLDRQIERAASSPSPDNESKV